MFALHKITGSAETIADGCPQGAPLIADVKKQNQNQPAKAVVDIWANILCAALAGPECAPERVDGRPGRGAAWGGPATRPMAEQVGRATLAKRGERPNLLSRFETD